MKAITKLATKKAVLWTIATALISGGLVWAASTAANRTWTADGTEVMQLNATALRPLSDGGISLGTEALSWDDGWIEDDLNVGDDVTIGGDNDVTGDATVGGTMGITGVLTPTGGVARTSQEYIYSAGGHPGSANGWLTTGGAVNLFNYTLPASEATTATMVIPISGIKVGWTITAVKIVGQIESAGNIAELDVTLRKITTAAGANVDALVGTIPHIHVIADTALADSVGSLTEVIASDETFYVLLSGTTAANTDMDIQSVNVTATTN